VEALEIPELAIAVAAQKHNPTVLNADFLAYNEIVPGDWVPSDDRLSTPVFSQVDYEDQGVSIACRPDKVVFTRTNGDIRKSTEPDVAALATAYVKALPHVKYEEVAVTIDGHSVVGGRMEDAKRWVIDHYLARGPWCDYGGGVDDAMVNLAYAIDQCDMRISIFPAFYVSTPEAEEGSEAGTDSEEIPVIRYSASFQEEVQGTERDERIADLSERIGRWRGWLEAYVELVEEKLMAERVDG
jgi:hypothetical protein